MICMIRTIIHTIIGTHIIWMLLNPWRPEVPHGVLARVMAAPENARAAKEYQEHM